MQVTASDILNFCKSKYGTEVNDTPGAVNLLYLEGCTASDLTANPDLADLWNDTSIIISYNQSGQPVIVFRAEATSEPGLSATLSSKAEKMGGVFRIDIGWHKEKWIQGFHKQNRLHPALVQCAPINGYRDKNMDGKRTGDLYTDNVKGLNQHGTRAGLKSVMVGEWSYACLVRRMWGDHMAFMRLCSLDPRYIADKAFKYSATVVDWSEFVKA
jgi:hypothetical protein